MNKYLNVLTAFIVAIWAPIYGYFAIKTMGFEKDWQSRVFVIENNHIYKFINPLIGDALGFAPLGFKFALISKQHVENANVILVGIIRHEAKHLEQEYTLGMIDYFFMENWKIEGVAEYARGSSTIPICNFKLQGSTMREAYREYHLVVKFLIETQDLTEQKIYDYAGFPLDDATHWAKEELC